MFTLENMIENVRWLIDTPAAAYAFCGIVVFVIILFKVFQE